MQTVQAAEVEQERRERISELETERLINVPSLSLALIVTVVAIVIMTVLAEFSATAKDRLADFGGHHWVGKGLIALAVFAVSWLGSAWPLARYQDDVVAVRRSVLAAAGIALAGIVGLFLFFVGHFVAE